MAPEAVVRWERRPGGGALVIGVVVQGHGGQPYRRPLQRGSRATYSGADDRRRAARLMSAILFLLVVLVVSVVGGIVLWLQHRNPQTLDSGIADFTREM